MVIMRKRITKTIFLLAIVGFLITNLNLLIQSSDSNFPEANNFIRGRSQFVRINQSSEHHIKGLGKQKYIRLPTPTADHYHNVTSRDWIYNQELSPLIQLNHSIDQLTFQQIQDHIARTNKAQHILNLDQFDLRVSSDTVVLVIQVHNRADYLKYLVDSLSKAKNIDKVLLIFSHDFYSTEVQQIVHNIEFSPVSIPYECVFFMLRLELFTIFVFIY